MPQLFKYFSAEYAAAFVGKGEIVFRALSYFRDYEDDGIRSDEHEGTLVYRPTDGLEITRVPTGEKVVLPHRLESTAKENDIFVYCMSTELSTAIAERFKAEVVVEVTEPVKFLARLRSSLSLRRQLRVNQLVHQAVRYYEWHEPPNIDWALPERIAMRKPKSFDWQKEYRFAVPKGDAFRVENVSGKLVPMDAVRPTRANSHPKLLLKLGNLTKICRVHTL